MADTLDYFKQGQQAARSYFNSQAYAGFSDFIKAEEAIKLYWPNVEEAMVMFSSPLPQPRQKWLKGFDKERAVILAENKVVCRCCGQLLPVREKDDE